MFLFEGNHAYVDKTLGETTRTKANYFCGENDDSGQSVIRVH